MKATILALLVLLALVNAIVAQNTPAPAEDHTPSPGSPPSPGNTPSPVENGTPAPAGSTPAPHGDDGTPEPTPAPPRTTPNPPTPVPPTPMPTMELCTKSFTDELYGAMVKQGCGWDCDSTYCLCMGGRLSEDRKSCSVVEKKCSKLKQCLRARVSCFEQYATTNGAATGTATTIPATPTPAGVIPREGALTATCQLAANPLKVAIQNVTASGNFEKSALQYSCNNLVCNDWLQYNGATLSNVYQSQCYKENFDEPVCKKPVGRAKEPSIRAQLKIGGGKELDDAFRKNPVGVTRAVRSDIALYLLLDELLIEITRIEIGSLIVDFAVYPPASGAVPNVNTLLAQIQAFTPAALTGLAAATGISVTNFAVTATAVEAKPYNESACGRGCIAGIVVGGFAFVVLLVVGGVCFMKKFNSNGTGEKSEPSSEEQHSV